MLHIVHESEHGLGTRLGVFWPQLSEAGDVLRIVYYAQFVIYVADAQRVPPIDFQLAAKLIPSPDGGIVPSDG